MVIFDDECSQKNTEYELWGLPPPQLLPSPLPPKQTQQSPSSRPSPTKGPASDADTSALKKGWMFAAATSSAGQRVLACSSSWSSPLPNPALSALNQPLPVWRFFRVPFVCCDCQTRSEWAHIPSLLPVVREAVRRCPCGHEACRVCLIERVPNFTHSKFKVVRDLISPGARSIAFAHIESYEQEAPGWTHASSDRWMAAVYGAIMAHGVPGSLTEVMSYYPRAIDDQVIVCVSNSSFLWCFYPFSRLPRTVLNAW